jgi:hypothetical protein
MKYVKVLGLLAAAVAALMAFAGTASATQITSPTGTLYTGTVHAVSEGHVVLHNPIAKIECESTVDIGSLTHGVGVTAKGTISSLSFTGCTNSWHVTVVTGGELEIHPDTPGGGQYDGTLTSSGATVESTRFGVNCRYSTSNTEIGTLTGGAHATLSISAAIPFHNGSPLCGSGATSWTGSYTIDSPTSLYVDHN